jgi:DNA polymerase alpha subunit A
MEQTAKKANKHVQICVSEKTLLDFLLEQMKIMDPDVIVGHNFFGYGLDVLLHRYACLFTYLFLCLFLCFWFVFLFEM